MVEEFDEVDEEEGVGVLGPHVVDVQRVADDIDFEETQQRLLLAPLVGRVGFVGGEAALFAVALLEAAHPERLLPARGEGDHLRDRIIVPRRSFGAAIGFRAGFPLPVQHLVRRARMTLQQLCEVVHPGVPGGARMRSIDKVLESGTNGGRR